MAKQAKQPRTADGRYARGNDNGKQKPEGISNEMLGLFTLLTQNAQFTRDSLRRGLEGGLDSRRSIDDECGFPKTSNIRVQDLKELYDREAIATRVVELEPEESWKLPPVIFENADPEDITEFENAWDELGKSLRGAEIGQESPFQEEEGSPIYSYLYRADVMSGIGEFGVLLLGLDDGKPLTEPAEPREGQKLTFLRPLDQWLATIASFDTDVSSPRFGKPTSYNLTLNRPTDLIGGSSGTPSQETPRVHWTRVLHIADNLRGSEVFGIPRMRPVLNHLLNLRKIYHADAEGYYKGGFPGLALEPPSGVDFQEILPFLQTSIDDIRDEVEQWQNSLQRVLGIVGLHANQLAPNISDPKSHIDVQLEAITIKLGSPIRVFKGSERGKLASSQDEKTWAARIHRRRIFYLTPSVLVPFIDRLIWLKVLPEPKEGYGVAWPDVNPLTPPERADVAARLTEAFAKFVQGDVEAIIEVSDWLTKVVGMDQKEVIQIIEAKQEALEEEEGEEDPLEMRLKALEEKSQRAKLEQPVGVPKELQGLEEEEEATT